MMMNSFYELETSPNGISRLGIFIAKFFPLFLLQSGRASSNRNGFDTQRRESMHYELTRDFHVWPCINKHKQTCVRRIDFNLTLKLFKIRDDLSKT